MYTTTNFKTKQALREAVQQWKDWTAFCLSRKADPHTYRPPVGTEAGWGVPGGRRIPRPVTLYAPGLGSPKDNGTEFVEGPHYPEPHRWYAKVEVVDGVVVSVK